MIVLIDDRRCFVDEREHVLLRTPQEGLDFLVANHSSHIEELWLDHDMGWHGTIKPVWEELERASVDGMPYDIGKIWVHTANPGAQDAMVRTLEARGYNVAAINADWERIMIDMDVMKHRKERGL